MQVLSPFMSSLNRNFWSILKLRHISRHDDASCWPTTLAVHFDTQRICQLTLAPISKDIHIVHPNVLMFSVIAYPPKCFHLFIQSTVDGQKGKKITLFWTFCTRNAKTTPLIKVFKNIYSYTASMSAHCVGIHDAWVKTVSQQMKKHCTVLDHDTWANMMGRYTGWYVGPTQWVVHCRLE